MRVVRWPERVVAACIAAVVLLLAGCAAAPSAPTLPLPELLQHVATEHRVCAVALALIRDGRVQAVHTASGCPNVPPPAEDAIFEAASLSKPVFARIVLSLADEGRLDLDAPLMQHLPDGYLHASWPFSTPPPGGRSRSTDRVADARLALVTPRMVLAHTSGLPNWALGPLAFRGEPGAMWRYSGEGYVLLQRAVERLTDRTLDQLADERVFKPAGMGDSAFSWQPRFQGRAVRGSARDGSLVPVQVHTQPIAAATLYTTARDYARFVTQLLADERTMQRILDVPVMLEGPLGLSWGQGFGIVGDGPQRLVWQWGSNPGYRAFVIASPSSRDGLVLLTNSDNGLALAEPLTRAVLPGPHKQFRFAMLRG